MQENYIPFYQKPPLTFNGNKKNMLKNFKEVLEDMGEYITSDTIFYDVFGGSGLLAHETKRLYPKNRVVWNDFDDFKSRLDRLEDTERLRVAICEIVREAKDCFVPSGLAMTRGRLRTNAKERDRAIRGKAREKINALLEKELEEKGKFDYIQFSSYLRFSNSYAKDERDFLNTTTLYNKLNFNTPLNKKGYLEGVERVRKDFKELISEAKERGNFFFILDPPYIQTHKAHYENFFGLTAFLELVSLVQMPFIFFSSKKSEILDFIRFCSDEKNLQNLQNLHYKKASLGCGKMGDDFIFYKSDRRLFRCKCY